MLQKCLLNWGIEACRFCPQETVMISPIPLCVMLLSLSFPKQRMNSHTVVQSAMPYTFPGFFFLTRWSFLLLQFSLQVNFKLPRIQTSPREMFFSCVTKNDCTLKKILQLSIFFQCFFTQSSLFSWSFSQSFFPSAHPFPMSLSVLHQSLLSSPGSLSNLAPTTSILWLCHKHIYNQVWHAKHFNINISQVGSNQSECTKAGSGRAPAVPDLTLWFLGSRSRRWWDFRGWVGMTRQLEKTPETW